MLAPWLVGVYIANYNFSVTAAGLLMSLEFAALAVVSLVISPFMDRAPRRTLAISGALLVLVANTICTAVESWDAFVVARIVAGIGYGMTMTAGNAVAAGARHPARLYGHKLAMFALLSLTTMLVIPSLIENHSPKWLFGVMSMVNALLIYPLVRLPQYSAPRADTEAMPDIDRRSTWLTGVVAAAMFVSVLTFFTRETMVYVFSERIGVTLGLEREWIGVLFALSAVVGIAGPLLTVWLGDRFGELRLAVLVVVLSTWLTITLVLTADSKTYAILIVVWPLLNLGGFALLMGLAGILDPTGRLISACGGAVLGSYAISPVLFSYLFAPGRSDGIARFQFACALVTVISLFVIKRFTRDAGFSRTVNDVGL